jgi:agmatine/peptidylarginine deiminase
MKLFAAAVLVVLGASLSAQRIVPEGEAVPRSMTAAERLLWESNPPTVTSTPPPTGPVRTVAEYEPMDGLCLAWEGPSTWLDIVAQIAREITGPNGGGMAYVAVDDAADQANADSWLRGAGVNMSRVRFLVVTTDTIWIRDYGPRYIYQGGVRAIVDHIYNRPRPNDDAYPFAFGASKGHRVYEIPLIHGGGNYHLDAVDRGYATRLIRNENPGRTEQEIIQLWFDYQRLSTTLFDPYPSSVDSTQHIDMWMQVISDNGVVISDWPLQPGSPQDQIADNAAAFMQARGYTVYRTPALLVNRVHYTYTNVVMFNNVVLIPSYTNSTVQPYNQPALDVWRLALPSKQIVQINGQPLVTSAGVFHCIVMHVPAALSGSTPSVYVTEPNGPRTLRPGSTVPIRWVSDDDVRTASVDVQFSSDGGASWQTLASGVADSGEYLWQIPGQTTRRGKVRVLARDTDGNVGRDESDGVLAIQTIQRVGPRP